MSAEATLIELHPKFFRKSTSSSKNAVEINSKLILSQKNFIFSICFFVNSRLFKILYKLSFL